MDFVINNYIIFIILGVILLMALIGYIADNTNFEKKPKKEKVKKNKKSKENVVEQTATTNENVANSETAPISENIDSLDSQSANMDANNNSSAVDNNFEAGQDLNNTGESELENNSKVEDTSDSLNMMNSFDLPAELTETNTDNVFETENTNINNVNNNQTMDNATSVSDTNISDDPNNIETSTVDANTDESKQSENNGESTTENSTDDIWKF